MGTKTDLTPLMIACQNNNPEEIKLLLAKKVRINIQIKILDFCR
jgi:ankyrin repeat protein